MKLFCLCVLGQRSFDFHYLDQGVCENYKMLLSKYKYSVLADTQYQRTRIGISAKKTLPGHHYRLVNRQKINSWFLSFLEQKCQTFLKFEDALLFSV